MLQTDLLCASLQDGTHPRPQALRPRWTDLGGRWGFAQDDENVGLRETWSTLTTPFDREITVPFPPESELSGIGDTTFHPFVWYRRVITPAEIMASGKTRSDDRVLLHFGAVDYRATVWIDGNFVGEHEGGQTPFTFDISEHAVSGKPLTLVLRAEDDPHDVSQPRGKQDWLEEPHVIWYHRTTGIWQTVWLESVASTHLADIAWRSDIHAGTVQLDVELSRRPVTPVRVRVTLSYGDSHLATQEVSTSDPRSRIICTIPHQLNGQAFENLLWSPENPRLLDARVELLDASGDVTDELFSYVGLRSVGTAGGHFLLNDRPFYVRSVLEQAYWPQSHLAAPDMAALRAEVQLIKDLGFNAARLHEKVEDPRFLFWADRLGLLIWGEMGSTFEYSTTAVERVTREWMDVVRRDRSHPCIVTWVPLNESWGVQHIAHDRAQLHFAQALYHLTKALDPTRPVISNDGWEHAESDIITIHDYATNGEQLGAAYRDAATVATIVEGVGPVGRRMMLLPAGPSGQPVMVTEFGGVTYAPHSDIETWGYSTAASLEDFAERVRDLFVALQKSPVLAGFCYTQLTDTLQEANGLTDQHRRPKLPVELIREIVLGTGVRESSLQRLRSPEQSSPAPVPVPLQAMSDSRKIG